MQTGSVKIYFDGGCRPNPGQMETAVVARGVIHHRHDCGFGTNNDAEWLALNHAAELAIKIGVFDVILLGDSTLVVNQATGLAKIRSNALRKHYEAFLTIHRQFERIRIRHIGRHQNLAGIALAKARWG